MTYPEAIAHAVDVTAEAYKYAKTLENICCTVCCLAFIASIAGVVIYIFKKIHQ